MKCLSLLVLGGAVLLGGCTSTGNADRAAAAAGGDTYVALGSNIPKKNARRGEEKTVDLQQLENERIMNNATINKP